MTFEAGSGDGQESTKDAPAAAGESDPGSGPLAEPRRRRLWPLAVAVGVVAAFAVVGAIVYVGMRAGGERPRRIEVRVQASGVDETVELADGDTVADALAVAGVAPHDGVTLSARDAVPVADGADPAEITVDGRRAALDLVLAEGAVIRVVDGVDGIEDTEVVSYPLPSEPLPDVIVHVHHRGRDGSADKVVGVLSGEIVSRTTVAEPVAPRRATGRVVALTFDDGPTTAWTPQILDILAAKGVKATFCMVGENVTAHPDIARRVVAEGHRLCNHTVHHDEDLPGAPPERLDAEIAGGRQAFVDAGLDPPEYFRPPGGNLGDDVTAKVREIGEQQVTWSVDTGDWRPEANVFTVMAEVMAETGDGGIILFHDGGGRTRESTVIILPLVIDHLRSLGYRFVFPLLDPDPPA